MPPIYAVTDYSPRPPRTQPACPVCGVVLSRHARCAGCGMLVGPGHVRQTLVGDLCPACRVRMRKRIGELHD